MSVVKDTMSGKQQPVAMGMCVRPQVLSSNMQQLAQAWPLEPETQAKMTSMFDTTSERAPVRSMPEISFCFWGFPPSMRAWQALFGFVLAVFQPRVFVASHTRESCVEMMIVMPCERLRRGRSHELWEGWLQTFLEQLNMSAGSVVFSHYMSVQMLACIDRIYNGKGMQCNLTRYPNRDFERLWTLHKHVQNANDAARSVTGMDLTASNMNRLFMDRRQLVEFAQEAYAQIREERRNMLEMAHIVMSMQRLGLLSPSAAEQSFGLLGVKPVMTNGELRFECTRDTVLTRRPSHMQSDLYVLVREMDSALAA